MAASSHPVAVVTGASSGIGRAIALQLAREGYALSLVARREGAIEEIAQRCGAPAAIALALDLLRADAAHACVNATMQAFGRIDLLVNSAGIAPVASIDRTTADLLASTFATNTFAPALLIAAAWPAFLAQRSGCIVNVSTMGTVDPFEGFFVYAASKCGLDSLTRSAAKEGGRHGVRAYSVNPGAVETPMLRGIVGHDELPSHRTLAPEAVAEVVVGLALGRRPEPSGSVVFLPSP